MEDSTSTKDGPPGLARRAKENAQNIGAIIRASPYVVLAPLMLFGLIVGIGVWLVTMGARTDADNSQEHARSLAADVASWYRQQLGTAFAPVLMLSALVEQNPRYSSVTHMFNITAEALMAAAPARSIRSIHLAPSGTIRLLYPLDDTPWGRPLLGLDFFSVDDAALKRSLKRALDSPEVSVDGPFLQSEVAVSLAMANLFSHSGANSTVNGTDSGSSTGDSSGTRTGSSTGSGSDTGRGSSTGSGDSSQVQADISAVVFVRKAIFVQMPSEEDTLGRPDPVNPACGPSCGYNATTGQRFWGFAAAAVVVGTLGNSGGSAPLFAGSVASPLQALSSQGYDYRLTAPQPGGGGRASEDGVVVASDGGVPRDPVEAVLAFADVEWVLRVAPASGSWWPKWYGGAVAAVVVGSFIASLLLFCLLVSRCHNRMLLRMLLPRQLLNELKPQHVEALGARVVAPADTPADLLSALLANLLSGELPDLRDVVLLRTVLRQRRDFYRPFDLPGKIREANLDTEVAGALMRQLGDVSNRSAIWARGPHRTLGPGGYGPGALLCCSRGGSVTGQGGEQLQLPSRLSSTTSRYGRTSVASQSDPVQIALQADGGGSGGGGIRIALQFILSDAAGGGGGGGAGGGGGPGGGGGGGGAPVAVGGAALGPSRNSRMSQEWGRGIEPGLGGRELRETNSVVRAGGSERERPSRYDTMLSATYAPSEDRDASLCGAGAGVGAGPGAGAGAGPGGGMAVAVAVAPSTYMAGAGSSTYASANSDQPSLIHAGPRSRHDSTSGLYIRLGAACLSTAPGHDREARSRRGSYGAYGAPYHHGNSCELPPVPDGAVVAGGGGDKGAGGRVGSGYLASTFMALAQRTSATAFLLQGGGGGGRAGAGGSVRAGAVNISLTNAAGLPPPSPHKRVSANPILGPPGPSPGPGPAFSSLSYAGGPGSVGPVPGPSSAGPAPASGLFGRRSNTTCFSGPGPEPRAVDDILPPPRSPPSALGTALASAALGSGVHHALIAGVEGRPSESFEAASMPALQAPPPVMQALPPPPVLEEVERLLVQAAGGWQFDMFTLAEATGGHAASCLGFFLMQREGLISHFRLRGTTLAKLLRALEAAYNDNPYHNSTHAADVLRSLHVLLMGTRLTDHYLDPLGLLAAYLAAIVHDLGHPGLTGDFLVATSHPLAIRYNDRSPLESHHSSATFTLLAERPDLDALAPLSGEQRAALRKQVIDMVLATDMKQHFTILSQFKTAHPPGATPAAAPAPHKAAAHGHVGGKTVTDGPDSGGSFSGPSFTTTGKGAGLPGGLAPGLGPKPLDDVERTLTLQIALKVADIGHLGAELAVHKRWLGVLEEEFFRQGDREKALGLPISPLFDRTKQGASKSQVGFYDFVALPLVRALAEAFPGAQPMQACFEANYAFWAGAAAAATGSNDGAKAPSPSATAAEVRLSGPGVGGPSRTTTGLRASNLETMGSGLRLPAAEDGRAAPIVGGGRGDVVNGGANEV